MNKRKWLSLAIVAVLTVGNMCTIPAHAGSSQSVIDETSYANEISGAVWSNMDEDVIAKDGSLIFPAESTESTKLITKTIAKKNALCDHVLKMQADIAFSKLPEGETFAVAFGLKNTKANLGDVGNVELRFKNKGGLSASLILIDEYQKEQALADEIVLGSLTSAVSLSMEFKTDQTLIVKAGNKVLADTRITTSGEGRIGFIQSGSCGATVKNVKICTYLYSQPENCNMEEDFEQGYFNANYFQSDLLSAATNGTEKSYIAIENYKDSSVLMFRNVGTGYLSTKMQYSNFEMTFDVPYIQRKDVMNDDGTVAVPTSDCFAIVIGAERNDTLDSGNSSEMIVFYSDVVWLYFQDERFETDKFDFMNQDETRGFSIKISLIDSTLGIFMKWDNEDNWVEIGKTTLQMADGYIQIADPSTGASNFAIDNLKIVNKDIEPKIKDVGYKSAKLNVPEDWAYQPIALNYEKKAQTSDGTTGWYLMIPVVAGACVVGVGITYITVNRKKKKAGDCCDE